MLPVVRIRFEPFDGFVQTLIEIHLFAPTQRLQNAARRRIVALFHERARLPVTDHFFRRSFRLEFRQQSFGDVQNGQGVRCANVVDHLGFALDENQFDRSNDIVHVEIMTNLISAPVNLQRFVVQQRVNERRNDFLDVLSRPVNIAEANDAVGQLETLAVRFDEKFRGGDRRCVRIQRIQQTDFLLTSRRRLSVDFVRADVKKLLDFPVDSSGFQHRMRAVDVRFGEGDAVAERRVEMRLN